MPTPEDRLLTKPRYKPCVNCLVVESGLKQSFEIFKDAVEHGIPGLWLTNQDPKKVEEKFGLHRTAILSLTTELFPGEATLPPNGLDRATDVVANYLSRTSRAMVILEGISKIIEANGLDKTLEFIKKLAALCSKNESGLVVAANKDELAKQQLDAIAEGLKDWRVFGA